ncbi:MAG: hypothetical protein JWR85_4084, partial [Marmoricola sp.]|nr:hypothetical protein [Marmoricola sp.]
IEDYNQQTGNKLLYVGVRGLSAQHPYRQRIYQLGGLTTDPEGHVLPVVVVGDNHKAVVPADKGVQVLVAVNRNALHDARQSNMITPKSRSTFKQ